MKKELVIFNIKALLATSVFLLMFNDLTIFPILNIISGNLISKLSFYPLVFLMGYTIYLRICGNIQLFNFNKFLYFISIYFGIIFIITCVGLFTYPYYESIISGPEGQIEKLPVLMEFLHSKNINVSLQEIVPIWISTRIIKVNILEILYTFGCAYTLYYWFSKNWIDGISILKKAIYASLVIIFIYSLIEIFYLAGNTVAKDILMHITPYFHEVRPDNFWWPPLLWEGQLRSVFAEPSYFGMYTAFAIPFIWYDILNSKKWYWAAGIAFGLSFLLFLTRARTGFVLFVGENVLLIIMTLFFRKSINWKKVICVILCGVTAFIFANFFISLYIGNRNSDKVQNNLQKQEVKINQEMVNYVDDNAKTLVNAEARSNGARYSLIQANFAIGKDHPIIGVGSGLKNAYITDYMPEMGKNNNEVKMWMKTQQEKGILKSVYPNLCEYMTRFAETGLLGLGIFLFPMLFLIYSILKKLKYSDSNNRLPYLIFLISFLGICATGFGDSLSITYCYWILLGLGYSMCYENTDKL